MADAHTNDDLKAKMRAALDRKSDREQAMHEDKPVHEKAHGSEVAGPTGGASKMHRRKAGGGGA